MRHTKKTSFSPIKIAGLVTLFGIIVGLVFFLLMNGKNIAVLNPQGIIASKQLDLIVFTVILGAFVVTPVFVMLFSIAWRYREGNEKKTKYTPNADGNTWLELLWWGIPVAIIVVLSVVTWVSTHDLDPYKQLTSDKKPVRVQVVALQWKWLFIYPELNVASVNELRIPEKTPVNFEITADSPMSAFWIPNLGSQVYAMNGMTSKLSLQADKIGEYRGSNTNISGEGYADMDFMAVVTSRRDFDQWAKNIYTPDYHVDLDLPSYEKLALPSRKNQVTYYTLTDSKLYDKVMAKYMQHDEASMSGGSSHESMNNGSVQSTDAHEGVAH